MFQSRQLSSLALWVQLLFLNVNTSFSLSSLAKTKTISIRVCEGSSCQSKCRGGFDPQKSFHKLIEEQDEEKEKQQGSNIIMESKSTFCMNQCKRGPNMRVLQSNDDTDQVVLTFPEAMNDTELKRKSFQSVGNNDRVTYIWGLIQGINGDSDGEVTSSVVNESGSASTLSDIVQE